MITNNDLDLLFSSYIFKAGNYFKELNKVIEIFNALPLMYLNKTKKFIYTSIKNSARPREYSKILDFLLDINLLHKVYQKDISSSLVVSTNKDNFKVFLFDVGLLRRICKLPFDFFKEDRLKWDFLTPKFFENYVLTSLIQQLGKEKCSNYWSMYNPNLEIDFLIEFDNKLIPIEVKFSSNNKLLGLKHFSEKFKDLIGLRIVYSLDNLSITLL